MTNWNLQRKWEADGHHTLAWELSSQLSRFGISSLVSQHVLTADPTFGAVVPFGAQSETGARWSKKKWLPKIARMVVPGKVGCKKLPGWSYREKWVVKNCPVGRTGLGRDHMPYWFAQPTCTRTDRRTNYVCNKSGCIIFPRHISQRKLKSNRTQESVSR